MDDEILDNAHLLREASKKGDVDKVKSLIEKLGQKNLDLTDNYSISALMYAAQNGHDNVVRILINAGAKVDMDDQYDGFPWKLNDLNGTALMRAAGSGHALIVDTLIKAKANVDGNDECGTALMRAAKNGHVDVVRILIEAKAKLDGTGKYGTALTCAAKNGHALVVDTLIKAGADVDKVNKNGATALILATENNHEEIVNRLIKAGAKVNEFDKHGTALTRSIQNGHFKIFNILINSGAKVDEPSDLMCAAGDGHLEIFKTLIDQKADVHKVNSDGATALTIAADGGQLEIVKILIDQKADVDKVDKNGTALMLATLKGHTDIVKYLLEEGAQVNLTNEWGNTALSYAIIADKKDNVEVVKLLLEKGAWPDSPHGDDNKTPLQIIAEKKINTAEDIIIAKLILEKGADLEKIGKGSKLYPLLKIIGNLADDEIKVVTKHFEDFKVISNGILIFKNFSEKESGPIQELTNDIMSMILVNSFPINLKEGLGEELTSKLVKNLLEIYSREESEKREANSVLLAPPLSPQPATTIAKNLEAKTSRLADLVYTPTKG